MEVILVKYPALIFLMISSYISTEYCEASTISQIDYRLPNNTAPRLYRINLEPHIDAPEFTFNGTSSTVFEVLDPTQLVIVHASELIEIDKTYTRIIHSNGSILKPISQEWNATLEFFSVQLDNILELGNYTVEFRWLGHDASDLLGFYRSSYTTTDEQQNPRIEYLVSTSFEPSKARAAYPCWDEPALKAEFDMSLKHYPNYTALSNMPVKNITPAENGKVWTRFQKTPLMSTYTSAFIISALSRFTDPKGKHTLWISKDKVGEVKYIAERGQKMMERMEEYTGIRYAMPKMDHIFIPSFAEAAMENWGLITYSGYLYFDYMSSGKIRRYCLFQNNVNHEVGHQWFGNLVTPAWWNEIWLSEAFAEYFAQFFATEFANQVLSPFNVSLSWVPSDLRNTELTQPIRMAPRISDHDPMGYFENYKGPLVLEMLKNILTERVFRNGLRNFLGEHQYGTAVSDDLWKALQRAYSEEVSLPVLNIKEIMDPWIDQAGIPQLNVTRDNETGLVTITQMNIIESETNSSWAIPINYATRSQPNFTSTLPTHWMPRFSKNCTLSGIPKDDWLILNIQSEYSYVVNYDWENWKRLADYLNSENYDQIHVVNRYQLINDIIYMAKREEKYNELIIDILSSLHRETHPLPWYTAQFFINQIYECRSRSHEENISRWMLHLMNNTINRIGFDHQDEVSHASMMVFSVKSTLFEWACTLGHKGCRASITKKVADELISRSFSNLEGEPDGIYCMGMIDANETIWDLMVISGSAKSILKSNYELLGCTENRTLIEKYLNLALSNNKTSDDLLSAFKSLAEHTPKTTDIGLGFFIDNYSKIKTYFSELNPEATDSIVQTLADAITTTNQFEKFTKFLNETVWEGTINGTEAVKIAEESLERSASLTISVDSLLAKSHYYQNFINQSNEL